MKDLKSRSGPLRAFSLRTSSARKFRESSFEEKLQIYKEKSAVPRPPTRNYGDADRYFKDSLRSYEYFDFGALAGKKGAKAKSVENLRKKSSTPSVKSRYLPQKPLRTPTSTRSASFAQKSPKPPKLKLQKKKEVEEIEVFYSPVAETLTSLSLSDDERTLKEEYDDEEDTPRDMGEEGEEFIEDFENANENVVLVPEVETEDTEDEGAVADTEDEGDEEEEDAMQELGKMIKQASEELAQAADENQEMLEMDETEEEDEGEEGVQAKGEGDGDGSIFKFDPAIDAAVLRELEEAEKQAKATAKIIYELKTRVTQLLKKEKHSEEEARELEAKNKELKAQMILFEEKTKRIQFLIAQTNLFDKMIPPDTPLQTAHNEDILPKVVVCGVTENNIPKLLLCDDKRKNLCPPCSPKPIKEEQVNIPMSVVPQFAKRLNDSYTMQERLAAENADLEGTRYKLQSDLLNKDQTIEYLQRKLCTIQCEMRLLCKENTVLNEKVQKVCHKPKKMPCGKNKGPCPGDLEVRINEYSQTTKILEKQLFEMENDVKSMQAELGAVQAEREHLDKHKNVVVCPMPGPPCYPCPPCAPCITPCADQQLRELREQYCRLQDDFKSKVTEVGGLRADNEKLKVDARAGEESRRQLEDRVRELERTLKGLKGDNNNKFTATKEQMIELEQQLAVAKQRFREAQDELEELRSFLQDQQGQLDDYRNKYLEAQQEVEEQRRKIDMLEMDANRVNEQVNLEIQRVKNQFQEKLQELLPLPELLKTTQLKLQEAQQMHLLAERNNDALSRDLQMYKDKIAEITNQLDKVRSDNELGQDEKTSMATKLAQLEKKLDELEEENCELKQIMSDKEELLQDRERELQSKLHEIAQLSAQLESVREESARQVARNKERCETVRRSMQNQISDLERQLAQSRAQARNAQKDRDDIRQKMQSQINNLHENFEDAQMRIRSLQGHVNFLKESYGQPTPTSAAIGDADNSDAQDPCCCGREF